MPRLVHLAPESVERRIERSGLRGRPCTLVVDGAKHEIQDGVFAMPVVPDFFVTHQWMRELRRWGRERLVAVHFSVPKDEVVFVGRFGPEKRRGPIGKMIPTILQKPAGAEVLVPRNILRKEIHRISHIRQDIGWVENPDSPHKFDCVCPACVPSGAVRLRRRLRRAYSSAIAAARAADSVETMLNALRNVYLPLKRARGGLPAEPLLGFSTHADPRVRGLAIANLQYSRSETVESRVSACLLDEEVAAHAIASLVAMVGTRKAFEHVQSRVPHLTQALVEEVRYRSDSNTLNVLREIVDRPELGAAEAARIALADE